VSSVARTALSTLEHPSIASKQVAQLGERELAFTTGC
jgi:hypothetical protein